MSRAISTLLSGPGIDGGVTNTQPMRAAYSSGLRTTSGSLSPFSIATAISLLVVSRPAESSIHKLATSAG